MVKEFSNGLIEIVVQLATDHLYTLMWVAFFGGIMIRLLNYVTIRREYDYVKEFEKRVHNFLAQYPSSHIRSFYTAVWQILKTTYEDVFEKRKKFRRRKMDHLMSLTDRLFLVQEGVARLIKDSLNQIRFLRKDEHDPRFVELSKVIFGSNPAFDKVFGIIPIRVLNDLTNMLPGMFVVGGIFGTFLGIMKALPSLTGMDVSNIEATNQVMDKFLIDIAFSMGTSILGIILSVTMSTINTMVSPESLFVGVINRYSAALEIIWVRALSNDVEEGLESASFCDPKDPMKEEEVKGFGENIVNLVNKGRNILKRNEAPVDLAELGGDTLIVHSYTPKKPRPVSVDLEDTNPEYVGHPIPQKSKPVSKPPVPPRLHKLEQEAYKPPGAELIPSTESMFVSKHEDDDAEITQFELSDEFDDQKTVTDLSFRKLEGADEATSAVGDDNEEDELKDKKKVV